MEASSVVVLVQAVGLKEEIVFIFKNIVQYKLVGFSKFVYLLS